MAPDGTGAADHEPAEHFDTGGRATGWIGLVACGGVVAVWAASLEDPLPLWVLTGALLAAVLFWSAVLRPRVSAAGDVLVLRNMLEDVRIPLAAVQEHAVRQVLAVRVDGKRYVGSGVGRSFAASRGNRGPAAAGATRGIHPADFVETRIAGRAADARDRARVRHRSAEQAALAAEVQRRTAWEVVVPLVATTVALVLSVALA